MKMTRFAVAMIVAALLAFALPARAQVFGADPGIVHPLTGVTASSHTSGQAVGNLQTISVFRVPGAPASGILNYLWLSSDGGSTPTLTIYLFTANPSSSTTCTDGSSFSLANADRHLLLVPPFTLTPATSGTGDSGTFAITSNLGYEMQNRDSPQTGNLYECIVSGSTFTPGSTTDLTEHLGVSQD